MNRRAFLKNTAMMAAATALTGAAAGKIRCAILGLGHSHALDVLGVLKASPDFELAGVCEPDAEVRGRVEKSRELKNVAWLDRAQLLGDETIKMVAVESAVPELLQYAQTAAEAGKHIHLDKPAGMSLPPFRTLFDTMEKHNLLLQMGYMFRYNAGFDLARRLVREGALGDIYRIDGRMDTDYDQAKRDMLKGRPGGMMFELCSHLLDMTVLILGVPEKVTPFLRHDGAFNDDLLDNCAAVFEFPNALAVLQSSAMRSDAFPTRRFEICGTGGSIIIEPLEPAAVTVNLRKAAGEFRRGMQKVAVPDHERHVRDFEDFAKCIRGEADFAYTKQHDYEVQRVLLQASGV